MSARDIEGVVDWLVEGARSAATPADALVQLCERLIGCGVPLWRAAVFVRTLHPQVMGSRLLWQPETGVRVTNTGFETLATDTYRTSPVVHVYGTGRPLRRRLCDPLCPIDFPILGEFRADRATDYLVSPLVFTNDEIHVATWTTREPGGFSDAQFAAIESIVAPLARLTEIYTLRRTARNLLDAYVGHQAGERILAGDIRRGHSEAINAVIWLSDMRGFTALADALPPETLIALLNRYFDCQVPIILARGGEVLKFMGDGLLAIFPIAGDAAGALAACTAALTAAREARDAIAAAAEPALPEGGIRFGLALHVGEVLYGNIGGGERVDFTCIGPAVNLAARIEKLTAETGHPILLSRRFAEYCEKPLVSVGEFSLRGFGAAQAVFGLAD